MIKISKFRRILLVDDNKEQLEKYTSIILRDVSKPKASPKEGLVPVITWTNDGSSALELLKAARDEGYPFHLLVTDLDMPMNGIKLIKNLRSNGLDPESLDVILISTKDNADERITEINEAANTWIGNSGRKMQSVLKTEIDGTAEELEVKFLNAIYEGVWERLDEQIKEERFFRPSTPIPDNGWRNIFKTNDSKLIEDIDRIFQFIKSETTKNKLSVLITGPTGSGKEVLAKLIHKIRYSTDNEKHFLPIEITSLTESLYKSQIFGCEKGAFTGATERRIGLIEVFSKEKATVFFDEIGEASREMQGSLLRLLQSKEIMRVGANAWTPINVAVIAATNVDLENAKKEKRFREDLYYRLNELRIDIPPLSKRKDDIPILINHFCSQGTAKVEIEEAVVNYLTTREWPGNVRELETFITKLMLTAKNDKVNMDGVKTAEASSNNALVTSFDLPGLSELETFNQRVKHIIFYPLIEKCFAESKKKSDAMPIIYRSVYQYYGAWFGNSCEISNAKIAQQFSDHKDNCKWCNDLWKKMYGDL